MDIVILGGGVVGATMAHLLAKQTDHKVTLIAPEIPNDVRYSAITKASENVFSYLDIWDEIIQTEPGFYDKMHLWDAQTLASVTLSAMDIGVTELGYIISNKDILNALYDHLPEVKLIKASATQIIQHQDHNTILFDGGEIDCKLVIGADGANSWLRHSLGIETIGWDYNHHAIVATVEAQQSHNNIASQRFAADGPLAFLPLAQDNLCSIVWSTSPDNASRLMALTDSEFATELGVANVLSKRVCFPLRMQHANKYTQQGAALIGDAAHVVHPLAGQGMNLGILDAATLAECLLEVDRYGLKRCLRKYERVRKSHNWEMIILLEACKRLFGTDNSKISSLRKIGMQMINRNTFSKNIMTKIGMGVVGELPLSARSYL